MHGGPSPGAPKRNRNASKNGRFTAKAVGTRRQVAELPLSLRELLMEPAWIGQKKGVSRRIPTGSRSDSQRHPVLHRRTKQCDPEEPIITSDKRRRTYRGLDDRS